MAGLRCTSGAALLLPVVVFRDQQPEQLNHHQARLGLGTNQLQLQCAKLCKMFNRKTLLLALERRRVIGRISPVERLPEVVGGGLEA